MIRIRSVRGCIHYPEFAMNIPAVPDLSALRSPVQSEGLRSPASAGFASTARIEPGRSCPIAYRYPPGVFARPAEFAAEVLYLVGGLYGNALALDALDALAAREKRPPTLVFNGDFHWFDIDPAGFEAVDARVAVHRALRGNVETELASEDASAGCGCAYPDSVDAADVERSNQILLALRATASGFPRIRSRLAALPMHAVAQVGHLRVAIVHGDLCSLAGWSLAEDRLRDPENQLEIAEMARAASIDVIASSHTCLPVAQRLVAAAGREVAVFNNGAAGMPNYRGATGGLITRVGLTPPMTESRHGTRFAPTAGGPVVHVDALELRWPVEQWHDRFLSNWPAGSAAHLSYWSRITEGPAYAEDDADRLSIRLRS